MSFETTCTFLVDATTVADSDNLESPSSRLILGRPVCHSHCKCPPHDPSCSVSMPIAADISHSRLSGKSRSKRAQGSSTCVFSWLRPGAVESQTTSCAIYLSDGVSRKKLLVPLLLSHLHTRLLDPKPHGESAACAREDARTRESAGPDMSARILTWLPPTHQHNWRHGRGSLQQKQRVQRTPARAARTHLVFITKGPCCATGSPIGLPCSISSSTPEEPVALNTAGSPASSLAK